MTKELLLPQNDPQGKQKRVQFLQRMRDFYTYQYNFNHSIAQMKKLHYSQSLKPIFWLISSWKWLILIPMLIWAVLKRLIKGYPFKEYKDYFFFNIVPYPYKRFLDNFDDDLYLGFQRVAGMNPTLIEGLTEDNPLPDNFHAQDVVNRLTSQTYDEALKENRLYITDYSMLEVMAEPKKNQGEAYGHKKYPTIPIALYYRLNNGLLKPLAIQLYATKLTDAKNNPIYTPNNGNHWLMARAYVQSADVNLQASWIHAIYCHYVMEGLSLGIHRNLATNHPLFPLLSPHVHETIFLNHVAPIFIPKHGKATLLDKLFACKEPVLLKFMGKGMKQYNFKDKAFPNDIKNRHTEDTHLYYPYRDDGQLVWGAIHDFVTKYVGIYYKSDQDVVADSELQALGDEVGGSIEQQKIGISGFPTQFDKVDEVVETVCNIIFIATAFHSCIHYPQYPYQGYCPNLPYSPYSSPSTDLEQPLWKEDLLRLLPPFPNVLVQSFLAYVGDFKVNKFGDYKLDKFDSCSHEIIKNYQEKLREVSKEIESRNQERVFPYTFMDPKNIPNSITV